MVGENGRVPSDDYFIFYNQDTSPAGHVRYERTGPNKVAFVIRTNELDPGLIAKCVFSATLDGNGTFADIKGCRIIAETAGGEILYEITEATQERSLVFMELYRHASGLKLRAVGRGFNGGLKPLAEAHGVEIEDEETPVPPNVPQPPANASAADSRMASGSTAAAPAKPPAQPSRPLGKIDLLKRKVGISLEKKNIAHEKARVAVIFDASGSMTQLYKKGTVQRAFERILAVSAQFEIRSKPHEHTSGIFFQRLRFALAYAGTMPESAAQRPGSCRHGKSRQADPSGIEMEKAAAAGRARL